MVLQASFACLSAELALPLSTGSVFVAVKTATEYLQVTSKSGGAKFP